MPGQVSQAPSLLKAVGQKRIERLDQRKDKPPELGGRDDLPAGLKGAVAQLESIGLVEIKNGDDAGKTMFVARGLVKTPDFFANEKVSGRATSVMKTFKGTDEEQDAALDFAQDITKMLLPGRPPTMFDQAHIEQTWKYLNNLKADRPHFVFATRQGTASAVVKTDKGFALVMVGDDGKPNHSKVLTKDTNGNPRYFKSEVELKAADKRARWAGSNPRVFHDWQMFVDAALLPSNGKVQAGSGVVVAGPDGTAEASHVGSDAGPETVEETPSETDSSNGQEQEDNALVLRTDVDGAVAEAIQKALLADGEDDEGRQAAWEALAEMADESDEGTEPDILHDREVVRHHVSQIATAVGITEDEAKDLPDYKALVARIIELKAPQAETEEPAPEPFKPAKGKVCIWNKKILGGKIKPTEVEPLTVSDKAKMITAKDNTSGKPIIDPKDKTKNLLISWDQLAAK